MQKKTIALVGLFSIGLLTTISLDASAQEVSKTTNGTVEFQANDGGLAPGENDPISLIKPGTKSNKISMEPGEGSATSGAIRFGFVPSIKFGQVKVSSEAQKYSAQLLNAKDENDADIKLPHFVQVIDERGARDTFKVLVSATNFTVDGDEENTDLVNSRIRFVNNVVFNSNVGGDGAGSAVDILKSFATSENDYELIESNKELLSSVNGEKTDVSASSVVLDSEYTAAKDFNNEEENKNVYLYVPSGEKPEVGKKYQSTINWTLEFTK